jgi:hypothetical protein
MERLQFYQLKPTRGSGSTGVPASSTMTATPRLGVLRIFGRYQEYGGEEAAARRIHETLKPYLDAEWLESSTDALLGKSILERIRAPFRVIHNERIAQELRRLQADKRFDVWEIHNVFPALSPSVYAKAERLMPPNLQYRENMRCTIQPRCGSLQESLRRTAHLRAAKIIGSPHPSRAGQRIHRNDRCWKRSPHSPGVV